ncbi:hypothetical protein ACE3NQ_06430 [Paenibacillus terreus]|uniref:YD repeat-containing protein n=1 Tax=Paenibacillus terreus TaxID=1387834 RepID=A0ABV5B4G2_9BACL
MVSDNQDGMLGGAAYTLYEASHDNDRVQRLYGGAFPTAQSVTVTDADGRKSVVQVKSEYDASTGLITSSTDGKNRRTQYKYDILGRVTEVTNPDGTQIQASYDEVQNTVTIKKAPSPVPAGMRWAGRRRAASIPDRVSECSPVRIMTRWPFKLD